MIAQILRFMEHQILLSNKNLILWFSKNLIIERNSIFVSPFFETSFIDARKWNISDDEEYFWNPVKSAKSWQNGA